MRGRHVILILCALALGSPAGAQRKAPPKSNEDRVVHVDLNGSVHYRLKQNIRRVSVGSDAVADVAPFPPDQLVITGKKLGTTTAAAWVSDDDVAVLTIVVGYPAKTIENALREAIPDGSDFHVESSGTTLIVSGIVKDPTDVERAERIAAGFVPSGTLAAGQPPASIVNLVRVEGDQQVQLEVSFAEVSRSALKQVGLNFWQRNLKENITGGLFNPGTTSGVPITTADQGGQPGFAVGEWGAAGAAGTPMVIPPLSGAFTAILALGNDYDFPFSVALNVLSNNGYARVLAEPTLVAMSGQEANFLAGGEFPIPLPQSLGQVVVEYKKFGVQLKFVPTVIGDQIQLKMALTVSDLDFSLGIKLASVTVPGLTSRHSETTVRLRDGQSFAVAGLLSDKVRSNVDKVPGLGDLPILGALFRSTGYRREETELLVVVTARLVRPQDGRPKGPGEDTMTDPSDLELFLLGSIESKAGGGPAPRPKTTGGATSGAAAPVGQVGFMRGQR